MTRSRVGRRARGNALVFALLGLLVSGLGAVALMQSARLQARREAGNAEATILDGLRNAANNAIFESLIALQAGGPISKNGITVAPVTIAGEAVWQPTVAQLVGMGYLPAGWTASVSTLNGAPYAIEFHRVPMGCAAAACDIEGHVVLEGALRAGDAGSDGAVIGPILARLGADSGVSLPMSPATITGFGNTWTLANPVAGQPQGVVAVRVGTAASAFGPYVRIGDTRDPDLAGKLTVAGDTRFGDGTTLSEFRSTLQVDGLPVQLRDASGTPCVTLRPAGAVDVLCDGAVNATTGTFRDSSGGVSTLDGSGLVTGGSVAATGDVTSTRDVVADGNVRARQIALTATVAEGDACSGVLVAMMASGGLATCQGGRFRATSRYAGFGDACATAGQSATDPASGETLVCRGGLYASLAGLLSSRVYMSGFTVRNGDFIAIAQALPGGCPAVANPASVEATIYLLPESDAETPGNPVLNRTATWTGSGWRIALTDGAGLATQSEVLAEVFCSYP